ncbi:unnamed protein product [Spodoptera exigua]|nr:unnamed protein product [Spodoptera exigua]
MGAYYLKHITSKCNISILSKQTNNKVLLYYSLYQNVKNIYNYDFYTIYLFIQKCLIIFVSL